MGEGDGGYCSLRTAPVLIEAPPVEPTTPSSTGEVDLNPCMAGQCLSPNGVCASEVVCFADPCDVSNDCDGECEANYCGGCHAVCLNSTSSTTPNDSNANVKPSNPTPTTSEAADYIWEGPRCTTDDDCFPKIRERVPGEHEIIGVTTCQCYPNSRINPLDECQGETDMACPIAGCMENPCADARAYCLVETGMCYLNAVDEPPSIVMPTATSGAIDDNNTPASVDPTIINTSIQEVGSVYTWIPNCKSDDDCYPIMRQSEPGESETIGVGVCSCYANSYADPLDECQGDTLCIAAMCMEDTCEDSIAFCSARGACELSSPSNLSGATTINSIATIVTVATSVATLGASPGITIDETSSNEIAEGLTDATTPASDTTTGTVESTSANVSAMNETISNAIADESTDFVADGTSSSVATSTPVDDAISTTTSSEVSNATTTDAEGVVENEESHSKHNETASQTSPRPGNGTSQEIELETTSTVTTEIASNETSDQDQTETSSTSSTSTTQTAFDETAVSENNETETTQNEIDKSQEGLPRASCAVVKDIFYSVTVLSIILNWFV